MAADSSSVKQLIKILIGAAWLDGKVQPEEQAYLQRFAQAQGVAEDPELKPWLYGLRSVSAAECQTWVDEYLGASPTTERYQQLLEDLSGLIYSDGDVTSEEARLLTQLQSHSTSSSEPQQFRAITEAIQKLYQRWMKT